MTPPRLTPMTPTALPSTRTAAPWPRPPRGNIGVRSIIYNREASRLLLPGHRGYSSGVDCEAAASAESPEAVACGDFFFDGFRQIEVRSVHRPHEPPLFAYGKQGDRSAG